jgi:hypothetical protein
MTRRTKIIAALAAVASVAGLGGAYAHYAYRGHGWHGWHQGRHHGFQSFACAADRGDRIESMIDRVHRDLALRPEQEAAWTALAQAVRDAVATLEGACAQPVGDDASARLARAEAMLDAGLSAVRAVRPSLDAFIAVLDEEQRRALDALALHRRG